ncbi:MAG TPA: O-antigen ligase family protein [Tepidisphaeraceae bacterium]|nr:O-antigen ligase family protein [Tepidisphaeraceae bacterium]
MPRVYAICLGLLMLQGWWMVLNARGAYQWQINSFLPEKSWIDSAPGAVDGAVCGQMMLQITAVIAAFFVMCDLSQTAAWRSRMLWTIVLSVTSIALYGIFQRLGLLPVIAAGGSRDTSFATYSYWGDAGTLLDLAIPLAFGLWRTTSLNQRKLRSLAIACFLLCTAGVFINVSKATMAIAVVILIALALLHRRSQSRSPATRYQTIPATIGIACIIAIIVLAGRDVLWRRWARLPAMLNGDNARLLMLKTAWPMALDAGVMGNGPGSFKLLLPNSPYLLPDLYPRWIVSVYHPGTPVTPFGYVDNDYIQTIIEWGWFGALLWAVVVIWIPISSWRSQAENWTTWQTFAMLGLGAVLAHSIVDAPLQIASLQLFVAALVSFLVTRVNAAKKGCG